MILTLPLYITVLSLRLSGVKGGFGTSGTTPELENCFPNITSSIDRGGGAMDGYNYLSCNEAVCTNDCDEDGVLNCNNYFLADLIEWGCPGITKTRALGGN